MINQKRVELLAAELKKLGLDAIYLGPSTDLEYIGGLDAAQPVWLSPFPADHPVIQLHAGLRPDLRSYNGRFCLPYADPAAEQGMVYVIVPGLLDSSLALLQ